MGKEKEGEFIIEDTLTNLEVIVRAADERMAQDIMVLDVKKLTPLADYFMILHARNDRQLNAIVEEIKDEAHKHGINVVNVEGKEGGKWILIDLNDIIVHVFHHAERGYYNLEKIWEDAPLVDISEWVSPQ